MLTTGRSCAVFCTRRTWGTLDIKPELHDISGDHEDDKQHQDNVD